MGFVKYLTMFLLIIALFSVSVNASSFEISGVGTKARGMAGAFRGIADDWTAAYYNPAGYAFIYDNQLGANMAFFHNRFEMDPDYRFGSYEFGFYNDRVNYNLHEILSNPSGGFILRLPFWGEISAGLSAFQLFDRNITWQLYEIPLAYNDNLSLPDDQYKNNLDVVAFQLTIAREVIEDKVSFGLGLQLLRADLFYNSTIFRDNLYGEPLGIRPWDKVVEWNKNDGNGYGFGLNTGLMIKLNEKLNIGINAKIPFEITVNGTSRLEFFMPSIYSVDSIGIDSPENIGTVGNLFVGGYHLKDVAEFETKLKLPASLGFGLAYDVSEKLKVSLDAEYTLWSQYEGLNFTFTNHSGLTGAGNTNQSANDYFLSDLSYPVDWENAGKVAFGLSYDFSDRFTFLGGVSDDQSPARVNSLLTPQFIDTGDKITISTGVIIHHQQWDFGVVTSYTKYPDLDISALTNLDEDENNLYDNINGLYKGAYYETIFSFNYRF